MKTPILGSSYVARSVNAADARMVNLFPEVVPEAGKEPAYLQRAPGLRLLATVGAGPIRGMWVLNGALYVVSGNTLYLVNTKYNATALGFVAGKGPVSMADNGALLFVAAGGPSYTYNTLINEFKKINDGNFPGAGSVAYLDGYFVYTEPGSQRFYVVQSVSAAGYIYPLQFDPLDVASAEGSPDGLVALAVAHREAWLFGTNSVEVWYNQGGADFPLTRIQGAYNELGCAAPASVAKLDNSLFWLGADARGNGIVYRSNGYTGARVSTHAVEWQIQQYARIDDAIGYSYQQDGHAFYVLTFPSANATWVYDVATGAWHERASWDAVTGEWYRHRSNAQVNFNNEIIVGDYENGNLYAFDLNVYADNGQPQRWLRSWRALPTGQNNLKRTAHHALQLDCETGVGLDGTPSTDLEAILMATQINEILMTEDNDNIAVYIPDESQLSPQVMLRWSDDGGHTWSNEHWRSMGRIGRFGYRTIWRRLGMTTQIRDRVYEVSGTDPVKIAIMGAELTLSGTNA